MGRHPTVILYYDGSLALTVSADLATTCNVNLRKFPFDHQICTVNISLNVYNFYAKFSYYPMKAITQEMALTQLNTEWRNINVTQHVHTVSLDQTSQGQAYFDYYEIIISMH